MKLINKSKLNKLNDRFLKDIKSESSLALLDSKSSSLFNMISFGFGKINVAFPPFIFLFDSNHCDFHQVETSHEAIGILETSPRRSSKQNKLNILVFFENLTRKEALEINKVQTQFANNENLSLHFIRFKGALQKPTIMNHFELTEVWQNQ